uniref:Uncharacterized protein n=1 Tax=Picea glauca TaxID=3330 RepID=A0A101M1Y6_PICGL|nr:hypothetical protein ABT39_MTgene3944 [Picea glauca]QHR91058.1 hypothetical protein Q903MT_gene5090 [Picea sitchensis]
MDGWPNRGCKLQPRACTAHLLCPKKAMELLDSCFTAQLQPLCKCIHWLLPVLGMSPSLHMKFPSHSFTYG